ncbi:MAG: ATP-dependent helicase RecG [Blastocatellia bacterium]|jgi:ATP-dependent DNA helicase RecG|nr:ATP-dependent helicase RecG [Blastocatellia bacterium]
MISSMPTDRSISLDTRILELPEARIPRFGPQSASQLAVALAQVSLGKSIASVSIEDLLNYLPARYEDRSSMVEIRHLYHGVEASLDLTVRIAGGFQVRNRRSLKQSLYKFEISAVDQQRSGRPVVIWWFVSGPRAHDILKYNAKRFVPGTRFIAFGTWEHDIRRGTYSLRLNKPDELELITGGEEEEATETDPRLAAIHVGRRVPVYRKLGEFRTKRLREIVHEVLARLPDKSFSETLPRDLLARRKLISRGAALRDVHFPGNEFSLEDYDLMRSPAHQRLIFEELFWLALRLAVKRGERISETKGATIKIDAQMKLRIGSVLPFKLTEAQRKVVRELFKDMRSDAPMNRLLQGDVGSGKTIVALIAMLAAMENGYQTALMVPTEILAEQHARNIKRILAKSPYRVELLSGSLKTADKKRLHQSIAAGEVHASVGTHALIQEGVAFKNLGLVIIDEQHRFGVMQRAALRARGMNPDVLVMTATPIPRSLAMTVYGDLDVSIIDELPPGRTPVETRVFGEEARQEVKKLIAREVRAGRQAYVVYPLVEESEKMDLRDATKRYEYLRDQVFPKFSVGLLHGRMKPEEKEEVMRGFISGETKILVSTTVIEVGVDVPNASVMVVEHAERFGLSQLHQLRGRVGRGAEQSFCVLLASEKQTEVARERLGIMEETNDGFKIAEKDLEIRGPGEVLGTRQAGLPEFRVANLVRDLDILQDARKEAEFYINHRKTSPEAAKMIKRVQSDARMKLAAVG